MSPVADLKNVVEPFLGHALRGDAASAVGLTLDVVDQGASVESVVVDLLAAAQYECGERWARNEWGVADEHLVSGVTQRCLGAIANTVTSATPTGSVVVACAEGGLAPFSQAVPQSGRKSAALKRPDRPTGGRSETARREGSDVNVSAAADDPANLVGPFGGVLAGSRSRCVSICYRYSWRGEVLQG